MEETNEKLHFKHSFLWHRNFGKQIRNTLQVVEKDGKYQLDQLCEKWRNITWGQERKKHTTYNKMKEG